MPVINVDENLCVGCNKCHEYLRADKAKEDKLPGMPEIAFGGYDISLEFAEAYIDKLQAAFDNCNNNAISINHWTLCKVKKDLSLCGKNNECRECNRYYPGLKDKFDDSGVLLFTSEKFKKVQTSIEHAKNLCPKSAISFTFIIRRFNKND